MNLIEQLAFHLEFLGLGLCATEERDGDVYWGHMPDSPDNAVCVFSTDSGVPGGAAGARVQVYARGAVGDVRTPYERSVAITEALDGYMGFLSGDGTGVRIETVNSAQGVGTDTRGRHLFSSNYRVFYCDD